MAVSGHNGNNETFIGNSSSIGLSFYDELNNEIQIKDSTNPIEIFIQRDSNVVHENFQFVNVSEINKNTLDPYLLQNTFTIKSNNASIHVELIPTNTKSSYLFILKLGYLPIINSTYSDFTSFKIFCQSKILSYFLTVFLSFLIFPL
jgi:hypothetical protein